MIDYGLKIKEYRMRFFLTQQDLATKLGVSPTTIVRWEQKKFEPTIKIKKKIHILLQEAGLLEE